MSRYLSTLTQSQTGDHAQQANRARYIVLLKGIFDVFFALGIIFLPIAAYDGPVPAFVSKITGLQYIYHDADPGGAYAIASLIMGCGVAALSAGMSHQDDAYKTIATLNGVFAYTALLGCIFSPKKFGSSTLLLAAIQDVAWFFLIINAGGYTIGETIGLKHAVERLSKKKEEVEQERERREREQHIRGGKEHYDEKEGYGATGTTTGSGRNGGNTTQSQSAGYGGQQYRQQHQQSSPSGGGYGGSGYGTGAQQHGGTGSGGQQQQQQRFGSGGSGIEGEFGSHGLKSERVRGVEHQ